MSLSTVFVKINTVPKYIYRGKSGTKIWATSVIFKKKLLNVNNRPMGENSPNPVTLISGVNVQRVTKPIRRRNISTLQTIRLHASISYLFYYTYSFKDLLSFKNCPAFQ
jgi:hypothetical protein